MKWFLLSATAVSLSLYPASRFERQAPPKEEPEVDLFKKNAQIYSIHAEFLYWTVSEGAVDYALKMRHAAWGPTPSYAQGRCESADYNMDPGFRLSLLYFRAPHYWEVQWQYTRMTNEGYRHADKPAVSNKYLTGTWPQTSPSALTEATSHIHLNYNVFDWLVDRVFFPNGHLRLRVLGGGFATCMDQDWKVRYSDFSSNSTTIRNKWHFVGGGLKTGAMFDWYWTGELYFTALWTMGGLMGSYSNHAKQTTTYQTTPEDNSAIPIRDFSLKDTRPVFTSQMLLGPSWQRNYPRTRIEVFTGFEMNVWFNLQEIYRSTAAISYAAKETWLSRGLLSLYGLTTRLSVDF
jgi:hypothetical protein